MGADRPLPLGADALRALCCPACRGTLEVVSGGAAPLTDASLGCTACRRPWAVRDGVPELIFPDDLGSQETRARDFWDRLAPLYGAIHRVTSVIRGVTPRVERRALATTLGLRAGDTVLELAAGTGRNLPFLLDTVGSDGAVFGLDLSPRMLARARRRVAGRRDAPTLVRGNALALPFADGTFDAVLDGFGSKYYSDKRRAIGEMRRVTKPGGTIVLAELGLPSGGSRTLRQRLLLLWIPGFGEPPPLDALPTDAGDPVVEWDRHETAYTLRFRR